MQKNTIQHIKRRYGIIGNAQVLNQAIEIATQVAPTNMSVLINGENGSGKESFSKIIHSLSPNKHGKLIAVNCGSIPEGTIDSELFGHEKGAFTGAIEERKGYFEEANKGTIFLDEIGEMPLSTQVRLLRILETGEFIKVGSSKIGKVQTRVIAATHVNLQEAVAKGRFREDLYYRINMIPLHIPPLRKRGKDILLLFKKFAVDFSDQYHTQPIQLTPEAEKILLAYSFPGNIRQLKNLTTQISALERIERTITAQTLQTYLPKKQNYPLVPHPSTSKEGPTTSEREILYRILFDMQKDIQELKKQLFDRLHSDTNKHQIIKENPRLFSSLPNLTTSLQTLQRVAPSHLAIPKEPTSQPLPIKEKEESLLLVDKEKELIAKALKKHNNKRKYAAKSLGIAERTLYRKMEKYNLQ